MKVAQLVLLIGSFFTTFQAHAGEWHLFRGADFGAPVINGKSNVPTPDIGDIVFDSSDSTFYGRINSTSWTALSGGSGGNVSNPSGVPTVVATALVDNSSGTPSITRSDDSGWSVSACGTACVDVTISGTFSSAPNCTCTVFKSGGHCAIDPTGYGTSTVRVKGFAQGSASADNLAFFLNCVGPQ